MKYSFYDYAVIGGDMRQVYLAEELAHHANRICHYALCAAPDERRLSDASYVTAADSLEEICTASPCVVCPIPLCKSRLYINQSAFEEPLYLSQLLAALKPGQFFFAGCIPADFKTAAEEKGVHVFDLMENQSLPFFNSISTAEGVICEAIQRSPLNLHRSRCAVLGYGKCGSTLAHYLKGMFCRVYVAAAPEEERAQAALIADQTGTLKDFENCAGEFDFVFNTIPAPVVTAETLDKMNRSVVILDIASAPGGIDFIAAKRFGIYAYHCPSLPGKYAPSSSGRVLKETIEKILHEF